MRYSGIGLGLCASVVLLTTASADSQKQEPAQATAQDATETVKVTGTRPKVQILPDRTVYSLDQDIQKATGSLEDVMKNLPLVEVDTNGGVTLRGESVTILVDGNTSMLFSHNQGDALQQIPASAVEKIEVITNPSAEFKAEGTGGVINIVMKKDRDIPASGIVRVNVGSEGRVSASINGNATLGGVKLSGTYSERRGSNKNTTSIRRTDGTDTLSSQDIASKINNASRFVTLSASYDIDKSNTVGLGGTYFQWNGRTTSEERAISIADATDITRNGLAYARFESAQATFDFSHRFATKGETFDLHVSHFTFWNLDRSDYGNLITSTGAADEWQKRRQAARIGNTELTARYTLPLPRDGELNVGYELETMSNLNDNTGFWRDATTDWTVDGNYTTLFDYDRTTHSGYATYRQKYGRFGIKGGIRLEQDYWNTDLKTTGDVHHASALGIFPSLYLTYSLTDTHQIGLSYSRRTQRPDPGDLSPARTSSDAFNVSSGNPLLKPEMIDSYEATYHYLGEKTDIQLTGHFRTTYREIATVYRYLADDVLLTTKDNLARRMSSGLSANINIDILTGLTLRASGWATYSEFIPDAGSGLEKNIGINWILHGGIDWQATSDDQFQFNMFCSGKQKYAQGSSNAVLFGSFGYKHTFNDSVSGVVTVNNLFDSSNRNTALWTSDVYQTSRSHSLGRTIFLGLVYTFGGAKDPGLSIEGDGGGAPT